MQILRSPTIHGLVNGDQNVSRSIMKFGTGSSFQNGVGQSNLSTNGRSESHIVLNVVIELMSVISIFLTNWNSVDITSKYFF
jgi:hypothetical protein